MQSKTLVIHGLKHRFHFWGNPKKPKLFLIHGWLDTGAAFHFLCEYLEKNFYCIAPDLRGYGKSEHSQSELGYFFYEYVADLHAIFEKFSPRKKISILGHSLGGAITSVYAGTYPERVQHLINLEGFLFQSQQNKTPAERLRLWLDSLAQKRFRSYATRSKFAERLRKNYPKLSRSQSLFLTKYLTKKTNNVYQMAADPKHKLIEPYVFSEEMFRDFWEKTTAKCLFVSAAQSELANQFDPKFFSKMMRQRKKYFPKDCQELTLAEVGHMLHYEAPESLAAYVINFLAKK